MPKATLQAPGLLSRKEPRSSSSAQSSPIVNPKIMMGQFFPEKIRSWLTVSILSVCLCSCLKSPKCWGDDRNKGIIHSSVELACFPVIHQEKYVITSDSAYQRTFTDATTRLPVCTLPPIDFDVNTLLGIRTYGQCRIKVIRKVTKAEGENNYHYSVTVRSCGRCKSLAITDNWVTVPKLPDGWTVTFQTEEK